MIRDWPPNCKRDWPVSRAPTRLDVLCSRSYHLCGCSSMVQQLDTADGLAKDIRLFVFGRAAQTGRVPQRPEIATALGLSQAEVVQGLRELAAGRVLILPPNSDNIWAANPFCAVPSPFRIEARGNSYWGICIWDALGVVAALGTDARVHAACGDCSEPMLLEIEKGRLKPSQAIIHFAIPAHHWWDNIGFT